MSPKEISVVRDLCQRIAEAKSLTEVNIAAGIAAQELGAIPSEDIEPRA